MALCLGLSICHCHKRSSIETDERAEMDFFFIFSIWVWVFIQKARNKRTCNRVKSSEYSNGTKGKINIRTCIWKNASWQSRKHTKTITIYLNRKRLRIIKEFRYQSFFRAILHCAVKNPGISKIGALPSGTLSQTRDLENLSRLIDRRNVSST